MELDHRDWIARNRIFLILICVMLLGLLLVFASRRQRSYTATITQVGEVKYTPARRVGKSRHKAKYSFDVDAVWVDDDGQEQQTHMRLSVSHKASVPKPGRTFRITRGLTGMTLWPNPLLDTGGWTLVVVAGMFFVIGGMVRFSLWRDARRQER